MKKFALVAFLLGAIGVAQAADPTGTWKWTTKFGEKEIERTMKLELKDGKVTGTVSGGFGGGGGKGGKGKGGEKGKGGGDSKIEDGMFKDGTLTFSVIRERGDTKTVTKYEAKVTDDTIKGTITTDFNGKENKQEFEAKKVKDEKKKD